MCVGQKIKGPEQFKSQKRRKKNTTLRTSIRAKQIFQVGKVSQPLRPFVTRRQQETRTRQPLLTDDDKKTNTISQGGWKQSRITVFMILSWLWLPSFLYSDSEFPAVGGTKVNKHGAPTASREKCTHNQTDRGQQKIKHKKPERMHETIKIESPKLEQKMCPIFRFVCNRFLFFYFLNFN